MPEKGKYTKVSWNDVLDLIIKEYGGDRNGLWYIGRFDPPEHADDPIIRLDAPTRLASVRRWYLSELPDQIKDYYKREDWTLAKMEQMIDTSYRIVARINATNVVEHHHWTFNRDEQQWYCQVLDPNDSD